MDPLQRIMEERTRQDRKWGEQNHHDLYWLAILMEEAGESAQAIIDREAPDAIDAEITQVAAVALAWLECRARKRKQDYVVVGHKGPETASIGPTLLGPVVGEGIAKSLNETGFPASGV